MISAKPNNDRTLYALRDQAETQWDAVVAFKQIEQSAQVEASRRWRHENTEKNKRQVRERVRRFRERKKNA